MMRVEKHWVIIVDTDKRSTADKIFNEVWCELINMFETKLVEKSNRGNTLSIREVGEIQLGG
jgi:hypothetical protein